MLGVVLFILRSKTLHGLTCTEPSNIKDDFDQATTISEDFFLGNNTWVFECLNANSSSELGELRALYTIESQSSLASTSDFDTYALPIITHYCGYNSSLINQIIKNNPFTYFDIDRTIDHSLT